MLKHLLFINLVLQRIHLGNSLLKVECRLEVFFLFHFNVDNLIIGINRTSGIKFF